MAIIILLKILFLSGFFDAYKVKFSVFTVTFDQCSASLLNKTSFFLLLSFFFFLSFSFFAITHSSWKCIMVSIIILSSKKYLQQKKKIRKLPQNKSLLIYFNPRRRFQKPGSYKVQLEHVTMCIVTFLNGSYRGIRRVCACGLESNTTPMCKHGSHFYGA